MTNSQFQSRSSRRSGASVMLSLLTIAAAVTLAPIQQAHGQRADTTRRTAAPPARNQPIGVQWLGHAAVDRTRKIQQPRRWR